MEHIPVLLDEVLRYVSSPEHSFKYYLDGTFGRGGHSRAIMDKYPDVKVVGFDRDEAAIQFGEDLFAQEISEGRLKLIRSNYVDVNEYQNELDDFTEGNGFDGILLDLGVSSPQLDQRERGFSFYHDGPLDMRMDQREDLTASDIVNHWSAQELSDLFYQLGEIRRPNRVVKRIVDQRKEKPFERTSELSWLIEQSEGWQKKGHHPATNYFLALRLRVNSELEQVEEMIRPMVNQLSDHGRLLVITFHSTEDRIVKIGFKHLKTEGLGRLVNKKVIQAEWAEKKKNPRARSAKLRVFEKDVVDVEG